tara:strand:- start:68 stop:385 length:318 start_codon:yes stop_codon:yes gene_type:complete
MRRTATAAAAVLPRELILQIQEHMPEGGKLSIPQRGCSQRFLLNEADKLAQDLEITLKSLRMTPTRQLAQEYEVSLTGVRKIVKRTLAALNDKVELPPGPFEQNK